MNAIEVLAQQQADEILQLETAYANLYHAYERGYRDEMISALGKNFQGNFFQDSKRESPQALPFAEYEYVYKTI